MNWGDFFSITAYVQDVYQFIISNLNPIDTYCLRIRNGLLLAFLLFEMKMVNHVKYYFTYNYNLYTYMPEYKKNCNCYI